MTEFFIPISHERRLGVEVRNNQQLLLSPVEEAMVEVSLKMKGSMKVTVALLLLGCEVNNLSSAIENVQLLHPVLRSKVILSTSSSNDSPCKKFVLEVDESVRLPLIDHGFCDTIGADINEAWSRIWTEQIEKEPLKLGQPLARFDIVSVNNNDSEIETALMVTCEHAFCDGQSISHLCHQLLWFLGSSSTPQTNVSLTFWGPSFESACGNPSLLPPDRLALRMSGFKKFPPPDNVDAFPVTRKGMNASQLVEAGGTYKQHFDLPVTDTTALLKRCKEARTTLTGALAAVLLQAAADVISTDDKHMPNVSLSCGADTRKYYTPPIAADILAYHVAGVPMFARSLTPMNVEKSSQTMWSIAREFRGNIEECLAVEYPLAVAGFMGKLWAAYLDETAVPTPKPMTLSLTNWGVMPLQAHYGSMRLLRMHPATNMSHMAVPCVITSSTAGCLTVTILTHDAVIDHEDARRLLLRIRELIAFLIQEDQKGDL